MTAQAVSSFYRPWWLPNAHLETVWSRRFGAMPSYHRVIATTPDSDQVAIDSLTGAPEMPVVVLFHGLEGCSGSHTIRQCAAWFHAKGWHVIVPHFRTCGIMNKLPRAYHAGDTDDIDWMLRYAAATPKRGPLFAIGISLGGNALAKWLGERSDQQLVTAAATVCAPLDLVASSQRLERIFNRLTYGRYFLTRLKAKIQQKLIRYPFLITKRELAKINSIRKFDDRLTAPMHGFAGVDDYYRKASALPLLAAVATPFLCLHTDNDSLVPVPALPSNPYIRAECTHGGGHAGFVTVPFPGQVSWLGQHLEEFFTSVT